MINDNIEGGKNSNNVINYATRYNLAFTGDGVLNENGLTDQYISINNDIINAGEVTVEGTTLRFGAYQHEDKTAQQLGRTRAFSGSTEQPTEPPIWTPRPSPRFL